MRRRGFLAGIAGVFAVTPALPAVASAAPTAVPTDDGQAPFVMENGEIKVRISCIRSADGKSFVDLSTGQFHIAGVSHPDDAPEPFRMLLNA